MVSAAGSQAFDISLLEKINWRCHQLIGNENNHPSQILHNNLCNISLIISLNPLFLNYYDFNIEGVLHPKQGWLPGSQFTRECLSEAVLLTPQRQHGSLAQKQCCELQLWPWRHVGGRSYVVSTFHPSSSSSPYSCTSHTDLWPSSMGPNGWGGGAQPGARSGETGTESKGE